MNTGRIFPINWLILSRSRRVTTLRPWFLKIGTTFPNTMYQVIRYFGTLHFLRLTVLKGGDKILRHYSNNFSIALMTVFGNIGWDISRMENLPGIFLFRICFVLIACQLTIGKIAKPAGTSLRILQNESSLTH